MTALTPQQMREQAGTQERAAVIDRNAVRSSLLRDSAAALRVAADQLEADARWYSLYQEAAADRDSILEAFDTDNSSTVIAAADEVDRLRAAVNHMVPEVKAARRLNTIDRLHALIENAPHDDGCASRTTVLTVLPPRPAPCTCWKADVL